MGSHRHVPVFYIFPTVRPPYGALQSKVEPQVAIYLYIYMHRPPPITYLFAFIEALPLHVLLAGATENAMEK